MSKKIQFAKLKIGDEVISQSGMQGVIIEKRGQYFRCKASSYYFMAPANCLKLVNTPILVANVIFEEITDGEL